MGHIGPKHEYLQLQRRLDRMPVGAPPKRALFDILEELFSREECRVATAMPLTPGSIGTIARRAGMDRQRVKEVLEGMVPKGLVVDLPRDGAGTLYFLNPTVVGFFEFTMMRVRDNVDQKKVAKLLWEYIHQDPDRAFLRMLVEGPTFLARPLVHEDALLPEVTTEILDHERASRIIDDAESFAEGLCHCRHVKEHLGQRCDFPITHCLSLGMGADYLVRAGISKPIDKARALEILAYSREHDAVQMADNVRNHPTFICNCCKCCCEMLWGFRALRDQNRLVTSNFLATVDPEICSGCGRCAKACPIEVIDLVPASPTKRIKNRKQRAQVNEGLCLGCAVCHRHCTSGALSLRPVGERVYTPRTTMERILIQALERGKLQNLLFDDPGKLSHRALNLFLKTLLSLPPAKQLLARKQIKSTFVGLLLSGVSRSGAGRAAGA